MTPTFSRRCFLGLLGGSIVAAATPEIFTAAAHLAPAAPTRWVQAFYILSRAPVPQHVYLKQHGRVIFAAALGPEGGFHCELDDALKRCLTLGDLEVEAAAGPVDVCVYATTADGVASMTKLGVIA